MFLQFGVRIVHEDADILVVDKPSGLLTVAAMEENRNNVFSLIKRHVREQVKRRGTKVWVIHRLDKEASGLIVFAKTEPAFSWIKEELRSKRVRRLYFAVVEGEPRDKKVGDVGVIRSFLEEDEDGVMRAVGATTVAQSRRIRSDEQAMEAKLAITHYRIRAIGQGRTILELKLETGRKNQIRAHMAQLGHPIVGDRRYGAKDDPVERVCLHAAELHLTRQQDGRSLEFVSPTPPEFLKLVGVRELSEPPPPSAVPAVEADPSEGHNDRRPDPTKSWDHVAEWYNELVDGGKSDHHDRLLIPGCMRLMRLRRGMRVLDVACGQGVLCRALHEAGSRVVGLDASPRLIRAAKQNSPEGIEYHVGDARSLSGKELGVFDRISCVMALMNIDPLMPLMRGVAELLRPGGEFVAVLLHPAFRAPGQTSWGWAAIDAPKEAEAGGPRSARRDRPHSPSSPPRQETRQFRRVDGYLSPGQTSIVMNPGKVASGRERVVTWTHHRPIQGYVNACVEAGLLVNALEEWPSLRQSEPGPRAAEENRARREIPMFLAIRAIKVASE